MVNMLQNWMNKMKKVNCTFIKDEKYCTNSKIERSLFGFGKRVCYYNKTNKGFCHSQKYIVDKLSECINKIENDYNENSNFIKDKEQTQIDLKDKIEKMKLFESFDYKGVCILRVPNNWVKNNTFAPNRDVADYVDSYNFWSFVDWKRKGDKIYEARKKQRFLDD